MKFRAAQQICRDHDAVVVRIAAHAVEREAIEQKAADAQKEVDARAAELKILGEEQRGVAEMIDRLNRELTEAHVKRRELYDRELKLCARVRDHAGERDRLRTVVVEAHDVRGRTIQSEKEWLETKLDAAKERIARAEQKKVTDQALEAPKVVHVGIDGKPWGLVMPGQGMPINVVKKRGLHPGA